MGAFTISLNTGFLILKLLNNLKSLNHHLAPPVLFRENPFKTKDLKYTPSPPPPSRQNARENPPSPNSETDIYQYRIPDI
jgi:hypothetical protein